MSERVNMPQWQCHKVVQAAKIINDRKCHSEGGDLLVSGHGGPDHYVTVTGEWVQKHRPKEGGYFVRYEDGYESFSPAAAFEAGYTMVRGADAPGDGDEQC